MGFTIQDMMIASEERYRMKYLAGKNGWANSISWVHLVEDTKIIRHFWGKELAVTTGLGFPTKEAVMELAEHLVQRHAAGLIVNIGNYIEELPEELLSYCEENDLPLLTVPWEIHLSDMMKDFSIRIFVQGSTDEQVVNALIAAVEQPDNQDGYRKKLLPHFDVDGTFQVMLIASEGLDSMDTVDRRKLSYRLQVYLEQITHNGSFFYYNSFFVLVVNAIKQELLIELGEGMLKRARKRMPDRPIYVGIGSCVVDIENLSVSYRRAEAAAQMAMRTKTALLQFERMGLYRLLYSCTDTGLLAQMRQETLAVLEEHDRRHNSNYVETLKSYLEFDGSIQAMAQSMFTHRNTIIYRMNNIKKLLGTELATPAERLPYQIAFYIRGM
ncbi:MAG: PucR family transcriptional regulator [Lachnospiraceae bacterium]|nr:PucR family transcriptional regulator [Lachnospiraceae bacterium]